ncbi:Fe-S cluster assembly protein SufD [Pseudogracilibacillus sp. SO30301A]|uniref:Fe-S cluster assembly protein SufD n=1 Tax=Pseudogracilibacillus sp. SO30301A TaxID=3098291 RepID=UPI00300E6D21
MTTLTTLPFDNKYVEQFSKENDEPKWMTTLRLEGLDLAQTLDLPKPDKTNITRWNFTQFKHGAEGEKISDLKNVPEQLKDFIDEKNTPKNIVILRNQSVAYAALDEELKDKGVIFTDIFTALKEHEELVQKYYMKDAVAVDEHKLTALHAALMNGGIFVYVPKNIEIKEPIQTIFWQEDREAALFNHVIVVVEENSEVTYVENYISDNESEETVSNIITEVFAYDNAKVSFGAVDHFAAGTTSYINRRGVAYRDATIDWALGQMNEGYTVSENVTNLIGNSSSVNARTVTVGRGKQTQNFTAKTVHIGLDTDGQISQRGVLSGRTTAIFNAIGEIDNGATRANAEQESRVLMLSGDARGDANPILLIDEDDVTAGHAASVGRVDDMQLYYLQSRGITKKDAERLIIHGFLAPVVNELPIETIKNQLTQLIEGKLS